MLDKLSTIEARFEELSHLLEECVDDYQRAAELSKERSDLEPIVLKTQEYRKVLEQIEETRSLAEADEEELRSLALADLDTLLPRADTLERELKSLLLPKIPVTNAASLWRFAPAPAAKKLPCSPPTCSACIPTTPSDTAGQ